MHGFLSVIKEIKYDIQGKPDSLSVWTVEKQRTEVVENEGRLSV